MSGDDLAVFLFLQGVALTLFLEGRKEGGWRRYFFWILAALSFVAGILWPEIVSEWPTIATIGRKICQTPENWVILIFFFLFVLILPPITQSTGKISSKEHPSSGKSRVNMQPIQKVVQSAQPVQKEEKPELGAAISQTREFTDKKVGELIAIVRSAENSVRAQQAFVHFQGLWMRVEGDVIDFSEFPNWYFIQLSTEVSGSPDVACLEVDKSEYSRLMRLGKNERVAIIGKIRDCDKFALTLDSCEIVATNLPKLLPLSPTSPQLPKEM